MITEDYVSFEIAKLLKEKEFYQDFLNTTIPVWKLNGSRKELVFYGDNNYPCEWEEWYSAPTLQMTCKWLRKAHNLFIFPFPQMNTNKFWTEVYQLSDNQEWENLYCESINLQDYLTYETACEAAIKYCLKNLI